jgi:4-hydroxythreonine-4-phosphate dehydrogenase
MIAITQGDPLGIGPEVTIKGFSPSPRRIHIGESALYEKCAKSLGYSIPMQEVSTVKEAETLPANIFAILPPPAKSSSQLARAATTTIQSIDFACQLAITRQVQAMVTPPINKAAIHKAGYDFPGHTEMLAEYTKTEHPVMMLATQGLRVVPATIHQALSEVSKSLTSELLEQIIRTTAIAMQRDFAIGKPRITVTGLNPHAGEDGAFGLEELELPSAC